MDDEGDQSVIVNEDEVHVGNVGQPMKRIFFKRVLKMKLAKRV